MSSLRYRGHVPTTDEIAGVSGGDFRLPRDPAVDGTQPNGFASVGLAGNPDPPVVLGRQVSTKRGVTPAGRPGFFHTLPFRPGTRDLNQEGPGSQLRGAGGRGTLAPGTIRRNVAYKINGSRASGFFSWAANELGAVFGFVPARPPQDEYVVSSLHLMLPDSLATVVSGTVKEAPGLEPFRGGATVQAGPSTGWPVLAPQIPSYGSRVPLRRPRGLVSVPE